MDRLTTNVDQGGRGKKRKIYEYHYNAMNIITKNTQYIITIVYKCYVFLHFAMFDGCLQ